MRLIAAWHLNDPERIRDAELPRSFRGYDEAATRALLGRIAAAVESLLAERDELRARLDRAGGASTEDGSESVGNALVAATRAAEEIVAEAEGERERLLEQATAEAREAVAAFRAEVDTLRRESEQLEQEIGAQRARFAELVRAALAALGEHDAAPAEGRPDILSALEPPGR